MLTRFVSAAIAVLAIVAFTPSAQALECPCNCYFSGDCEGGAFCDWGNLSQEDSCFWRQPKPQGTPGAGCQDDYNDWGQCDGICNGAAAVAIFKDERQDDLVAAIDLWADSLTNSAVAGGGHPDGDLVQQVAAIPFKEPRMMDSIWRVTMEVLTLSRGDDFFIFPDDEYFHSENVQVKDLSNDPQLVRLGDLAIAAFRAEVNARGSGLPYIEQIRALGLDARLDGTMFARMCDTQSPLACLYGKISDIGEAVGRGGRDGMAAATGGPSCETEESMACQADLNNSGEVDVDDLVGLFLRWGPQAGPTAADLDGDLVVGVNDLVIIIEMWGAVCLD